MTPDRAALTDLYRYPVKGVGCERIERAELRAGRAMPNDRLYALAHAGSGYDGSGAWTSCRDFVHPTHAPKLAALRTRFDPDTRRFHAEHPDLQPIDADLSTPQGRAALAAWVEPLAAEVLAPPYRLVAARGAVYFGDVEQPAVSILSHASLRALSQHAGRPLDPRRFRGNLWIDGLAPWAEFDWVGRELRIGAARFRVIERTKRCLATAADPETGARDVLPTRLLSAAYDHTDFGVLAEVVEGGAVAVGDSVTPPSA